MATTTTTHSTDPQPPASTDAPTRAETQGAMTGGTSVVIRASARRRWTDSPAVVGIVTFISAVLVMAGIAGAVALAQRTTVSAPAVVVDSGPDSADSADRRSGAAAAPVVPDSADSADRRTGARPAAVSGDDFADRRQAATTGAIVVGGDHDSADSADRRGSAAAAGVDAASRRSANERESRTG